MASVLMKMQIDGRPDAGTEDFVFVEVDRRDVGEAVQLAGSEATGHDVAQAQETLARSFDRLAPALSAMLLRLRSAEHAPDQIEMEFGIKLGGEAGLIFARGTAEANFVVRVTWAKPTAPSESPAPGGPNDGDEAGLAQ